jgi:hypothetical protein
MGVKLVRAVARSISVGVAALIVGYAVKSAGTPTGPAEAGLQAGRSSISIFAVIRPEIVDLRSRVGRQVSARPGVRVASLEAELDSAAAVAEPETQADVATSTRHASFDERFTSSFDERLSSASFDERFTSLDARPREEDESVVFGGPVWPMPFADALQAPLRTFASPGQLRTNGVLPPNRATHQTAPLAVGQQPARESATVTPPPLPPASKKLVRTADAVNEPFSPSDADGHTATADGHTAIYDIAAHAVYLPNGEKLEAHSGLGSNLDNPQSIGVKGRGPTPPNVYELSLRKQPFHGIRAIRLTPVGEAKMFGRDGMLAHSYMLGPNGQSNGCVSFSNYPAFLNAYLRGEVDHLVVVEHLANAPTPRAGLGWLPEPLRNLFNPS